MSHFVLLIAPACSAMRRLHECCLCALPTPDLSVVNGACRLLFLRRQKPDGWAKKAAAAIHAGFEGNLFFPLFVFGDLQTYPNCGTRAIAYTHTVTLTCASDAFLISLASLFASRNSASASVIGSAGVRE